MIWAHLRVHTINLVKNSHPFNFYPIYNVVRTKQMDLSGIRCEEKNDLIQK